jgi:hypothetical protein|nr:MAG TPA: hypothetical protein [Crassvirales sp.]
MNNGVSIKWLIIALVCSCISLGLQVAKLFISKENKETEKVEAVWIHDKYHKYTEFEPSMITFISKTDSTEVLYAIEQNEESQGYFNLYLLSIMNGREECELVGSSKSFEKLQLLADIHKQTLTDNN